MLDALCILDSLGMGGGGRGEGGRRKEGPLIHWNSLTYLAQDCKCSF